MDTKDEALLIPNPRLLAAAYFALLAIIMTIAIDTLMYALGMEELLPIAKAILLAAVIAGIFGALFGKRIIHSEKPYHMHVFLWAFLMVLVALPFYNLGFIYFLREDHAVLFEHANFMHLVYLYLFVLLYGFILAGMWIAIIAGLAALYLRTHLVYHLMHSLNQQRRHHEEHQANTDLPQSEEAPQKKQ